MASNVAELFRPYVEHGHFRLASGLDSTWRLDAKQVTFGNEAPQAVEAMFDLLAANGIDLNEVTAFAGVELGGVPLAIAMAAHSGRRSFTVRRHAKTYGEGGRFAGPYRSGDRVVVVDDVWTTGGSGCRAIEAIQSADGTVVAFACLLNRGNPNLTSIYDGIPFLSLMTPSDLGMTD